GESSAGHGQGGAHEEAFDPAVAEPVGDRGAARERQEDPAQGRPEGHPPHPTHLLQVGLHPGDEHQEDDADLGEVLHHAGEVRVGDEPLRVRREDRPLQKTQEARAEKQPREDLAEDGRLSASRAEPAGPLRSHGDEGQEQKELQDVVHDPAIYKRTGARRSREIGAHPCVLSSATLSSAGSGMADTLQAADDTALVSQLKAGRESAFEEVLRRYEKKVYSLVRGLTRNDADAQDALQETFLSVYKKIGSFNEASSLSTWIYRIAVN